LGSLVVSIVSMALGTLVDDGKSEWGDEAKVGYLDMVSHHE